jgi:hypothetical protein
VVVLDHQATGRLRDGLHWHRLIDVMVLPDGAARGQVVLLPPPGLRSAARNVWSARLAKSSVGRAPPTR